MTDSGKIRTLLAALGLLASAATAQTPAAEPQRQPTFAELMAREAMLDIALRGPAPPSWEQTAAGMVRPASRLDRSPLADPVPQPPSLAVALQDDTPRPAGEPGGGDLPSSSAAAEQTALDAAPQSTGDPQQRYGEAPVDRTQQFLRRQTPLLNPGQWQVDYGLVYSLQENDFPGVFAGGALARVDLRQRSLTVPLAVRYGWSERTQLFVNVPLGWADTEVASAFGDQSEATGGIGDLEFGFNRLICASSGEHPAVIGSLRASAPTGNPLNPLVVTSTGTGSGAWRLGGDLLMVQSYDPLVLFWGGGYRYSFEDEYSGVDIQLGHQFLYNFGVGFAANERITLSTSLLGAFVTEARVNDQLVPNSDFEPIRVRMAATMWKNCKLVEPFVSFGITETAPSSELGIIWTY